MSWHYQIRKRIINNEPWFDIVEYFDNPKGWTQQGIKPESSTRVGVIKCLELMLKDAKKYKTIVEDKCPAPTPNP